MICLPVLRGLFSQCTRGLKTVAVIGGGQMGTGITQVCIQSGYDVKLVDVSPDILSKSINTIRKNMTRDASQKFPDDANAAKEFVDTRLSRLKTTVDITDAVRDPDLVIESVAEQLSVKHEVFRTLEKCAPANSIVVSNTSSLSLKDIGSVLSNPSRFAGLHFFNPVPVLRLVEVARTQRTSEDTFRALSDFVKSLDKVPIVCRDTPGFVVNRLLIPYLLDAIRLVERSEANFRDVDMAMKLGTGHPMGPLELCDFIGLDTMKYVSESITEQLPNDPTFVCPTTLQKLVDEKKLGRKSGEGFYKYDSRGRIMPE